MIKLRINEGFYSNDRYEEAQNYIDNGMTTWREIFQDCLEIARTDKELHQSMIDQCGSISKYAEEIFAAVHDILGDGKTLEPRYIPSVTEGYDPTDNLEDIWNFVQEQEYDSRATSQNQLPGGVKAVTDILQPGTINLDYGGGRYDKAVEWLKQVEVMNLVFDPFNRSQEHNREVLDIIQEAGGADSCTCCNVLNVIDGDKAKITALKNIKRLVKTGGKVYIQTYEGSDKDKVEVQNDKGRMVRKPSGVGHTTTKGWQENKETLAYLPLVEQVFDDATYKRIGGVPMIVCTA